jgi:hypothetical protein
LFQQLFVGFDATTNGVASTRQDLLAPHLLHQARRISTVHLPVTRPNTGYPGSGRLGGNDPVSWLVGIAFSEHSSNPFLHTYHPDHDNLDDRDPLFVESAAKGDESYDITRRITLIRQEPEATFEALTRGAQTLEGRYEETITLGRADSERAFLAQGTFTLQRVLDVPTLLEP